MSKRASKAAKALIRWGDAWQKRSKRKMETARGEDDYGWRMDLPTPWLETGEKDPHEFLTVCIEEGPEGTPEGGRTASLSFLGASSAYSVFGLDTAGLRALAKFLNDTADYLDK